MKTSIHTMYFLPDFGSAPILINELATYLAGKGHDIEVVTTLPRKRTPGLKSRFCITRRENGFLVKRFWTNKSPHPLSRLLAWNIYTAETLFNAMGLRKGDIAFLRTPPLQLGVTGLLAKKLRGARILLNVQDIHPDLSIESGILTHPVAIRFAKGLEKWVYGISDHILVISDGFKRNLMEKGVPEAKLSVIPNWVDTDFLKPSPKDNPVSRKFGLADKFVAMYSGTISISSNLALGNILETAKTMSDRDDIRFVIVGEGLKKTELQDKASALGLKNVLFLPFQPYADLPDLLASSDVLLVPLDKDKSQISVPSKLYNFMAAGRPILGLATPDSEVAAIIHSTRCGDTAAPDDISGIRETLLRLKDAPESHREMAANARDYVCRNFSKDIVLGAYEKLLDAMTSGDGAIGR